MFLPIVVLLYYLVPNKYKNILLLVSSLYFYAFGERELVLMIIASTVVNYFLGIYIEEKNKKIGLRLSIAFNLLTLGFFKYFNFTFDNFNALLVSLDIHSESLQNLPKIALPIGISFYTFECLSYTIDVYRGHVKANKNYIEFATFVTLFPQLVAGPIVRYIDVKHQLSNKSKFDLNNFTIGLERFIIGLTKKMLIANNFASIADSVFNYNVNEISTYAAWLGIIAYSIQIYFDFSAYSDMAIGLGKMFGFEFLENFNYPYISKSIKEFWRRWHISLSSWFRDYLYIPLGGNKQGKFKTYFNLFIVFLVTGLWHGANWTFLIWGLFHGVFLIIERSGFDKILIKIPKVLQHLYALFIVLIGWVFFRAENLDHAIGFLQKMFVFQENITLNTYLNFIFVNTEFYFLLTAAIVFSMPVYQLVEKTLNRPNLSIVRAGVFATLFFACIIFVAADSYNPFIYFKF